MAQRKTKFKSKNPDFNVQTPRGVIQFSSGTYSTNDPAEIRLLDRLPGAERAKS